MADRQRTGRRGVTRMEPIEVAGWRILPRGTAYVEGQDVGGRKGRARAYVFTARHEGVGELELGRLDFGTSRDVRCLGYSREVPEVLHRLKHGLRLAVQDTGDGVTSWVELRQARIKPGTTPAWSNLFGATEEDLDRGAGLSVRRCLEGLGGQMGTRGSLLSEKGRRRGASCVLFHRDNLAVPLAAYLLTRVLPLLAGMEGRS